MRQWAFPDTRWSHVEEHRTIQHNWGFCLNDTFKVPSHSVPTHGRKRVRRHGCYRRIIQTRRPFRTTMVLQIDCSRICQGSSSIDPAKLGSNIGYKHHSSVKSLTLVNVRKIHDTHVKDCRCRVGSVTLELLEYEKGRFKSNLFHLEPRKSENLLSVHLSS